MIEALNMLLPYLFTALSLNGQGQRLLFPPPPMDEKDSFVFLVIVGLRYIWYQDTHLVTQNSSAVISSEAFYSWYLLKLDNVSPPPEYLMYTFSFKCILLLSVYRIV